MKKILVAVDGSKYSDKALEKAKEFVSVFGSDVVLIYVNEAYKLTDYNGMKYHTDKIIQDKIKKDAEGILKRAEDSFSGANCKITKVTLEGDAAAEIIEYVNTNELDLVIMGSHGTGGLRRFFLGSVSHKVMLHVNKSILIAR